MREKGEGGSDSGLEGGAGRSERRRPVVPRGVLADAWPPRGVRALAWSGECAANERGAAEIGRARCEAGWLRELGRKRGARPTKVK